MCLIENNVYKLVFGYSGLDIECTEIINEDLQQRVINEIEDVKKNDPVLCIEKTCVNKESKPVLYAKSLAFKSWHQLGKWLLKIYDHMFENYDHSVINFCI